MFKARHNFIALAGPAIAAPAMLVRPRLGGMAQVSGCHKGRCVAGLCFLSVSDGLVHMVCIRSDKSGSCSRNMWLAGC